MWFDIANVINEVIPIKNIMCSDYPIYEILSPVSYAIHILLFDPKTGSKMKSTEIILLETEGISTIPALI